MSHREQLALAFVTVVAGVLRFASMDVRGRFDVDQGRDMLQLAAISRDGIIPLVGPKAWVGDVHHGALYYYLLTPAAAISNDNLPVVSGFVALLGIAAVVVTFWLGRAIGGGTTAFLAGLLLAVSPSAVEASRFIWNPNLIPVFSVLSIAAAWKARDGGHWAWWAVSLGAAAVIVQLHLLGAIFFVPVVVLCLLAARDDRRVLRGLLAGLGLLLSSFVPLLASEIQTGFAETQGLARYLTGSGVGGSNVALVAAPGITFLRIVATPLVGVITEVPEVAAVVAAIVVGVAVWGLRTFRGPERVALTWMAALVLWTTLALTLTTPSMQRVTVNFPNDQYHAFIYPFIPLILAIPGGRLVSRAWERWTDGRHAVALIPTLAVSMGFVFLSSVGILRSFREDPNGGWRAAELVGRRINPIGSAQRVYLVTLPPEQSGDAIRWPILAAGGSVSADPGDSSLVVVACNRDLEDLVAATCGGEAEDRAASAIRPSMQLLDRFEAPRQMSVSVYQPASRLP